MNGVPAAWLLVLLAAAGCGGAPDPSLDAEPFGRGPFPVGSTNMEIEPGYTGIGDEAMHAYLLGRAAPSGQPRYLADILRYPDTAWIVDVPVPADAAAYGPASGLTLPVVTFLAFPSGARQEPVEYAFPYHDAAYGVFEDMLGPGETPRFADPGERYPLIVLAHGDFAHGIFDVGHAHRLASHGFIVAVINYGDDRTRTAVPEDPNHHVSFLRPLMTKAVIDDLLASATFGAHIDADRIGISGHSFGGFTALAVAGGRYRGSAASVIDERIGAAVLAAPWVGDDDTGRKFFAFGADNGGLDRVHIPVLCLFGTRDEVTPASLTLPAVRQLSGPTYVVELVDQPHVFEQGSWEDRDNWELLFFGAYLKHDPDALATLAAARSFAAGNEDIQLFDYQRLP